MPDNKGKKTEEVVPMVDTVNQNIYDFAAKEEAEADRIFYESQGLQADGKTPLDEEPAKNEPGEEELPGKKEEEPGKEPEPGKEELPGKKEEPSEADLTKDLTTDNANLRISSAQKKMHESNKRAKEAETKGFDLAKENEELRKLIDAKATTGETGDPSTKEGEKAKATQTDDEIDAELTHLRTEYPEIAEPIIKIMQAQKADNKLLLQRLDKLDEREKTREKTAKTDTENAHYNAIETAHPDFDEISKEPLIDDWIEGLPPMEKAGALAIRKDGTTKEVISLLTNFKKANGYKVPGEKKEIEETPNKADSKLKKAKGMSVPEFNKAKNTELNDKKVRFTRAQIAAMTETEWAENEPAIDEAMKLGLVR